MKTKTKEIFDGAIFLLLTIALNVGMFYLRYKVVLENSEILFFFLGFLQVIFGVVFLVVSGIRNE